MKIAIIGTGNIGSTLARKWLQTGHEIFIGARDAYKIKGETLAAEQNVTVKSISEAAAAADVILMAIPAHVIIEVIKELGDVSNKIIIDATNTVLTKPDGYNNAFEALIQLTGAGVVKCFNTTGFNNMANPVYNEQPVDMFMAGDNSKAKSVAMQLALETGFADCIDFGGNNKVALLEQFAHCWINLALTQGIGRNIAFKLLKR